MKTLQALLAACALSALPLYAADDSDLTYATAAGEGVASTAADAAFQIELEIATS